MPANSTTSTDSICQVRDAEPPPENPIIHIQRLQDPALTKYMLWNTFQRVSILTFSCVQLTAHWSLHSIAWGLLEVKSGDFHSALNNTQHQSRILFKKAERRNLPWCKAKHKSHWLHLLQSREKPFPPTGPVKQHPENTHGKFHRTPKVKKTGSFSKYTHRWEFYVSNNPHSTWVHYPNYIHPATTSHYSSHYLCCLWVVKYPWSRKCFLKIKVSP